MQTWYGFTCRNLSWIFDSLTKSFTVNCKPTHTENNLKLESVNPLDHKKGFVRSVVTRCLKICSNKNVCL